MKTLILLLALSLLLSSCGSTTVAEVTIPETTAAPVSFSGAMAQSSASGQDYVSQFDSETLITLSDDGITVEGNQEAVFPSHDIVYYEDRDSYDSGNPYGEGTEADRHTAEEAAAHTVVNITAPGAYRVSGKLSAGQIRVDLGESAYYDPEAVVELILEDADITCTVAPAILFRNTYECDGNWSTDTAKAEIDTRDAGANLILQGKNTVSGAYVAKIYKDAEGEKKLWKQDGAIYSYMSLNVFGPGSLELTAANEGLDTELHLSIHGGDIAIRSQNDGINTNEDGVSVTTIHGGSLHIIAGLGEEGDGIDSNGYLVINGGTVVASANPAGDAGLDSDLGSFVNGGTVIALGSTMDWAESDSDQVTMNLQFAQMHSGGAIVVTKEDGTVVFAYDPVKDEILGENTRGYMGAVVSCPGFARKDTYYVYLDGTLTGEEVGGVYTSVNSYIGGIRMGYSGTDLQGGMGVRPGGMEFAEGERPAMPEGFEPETMPEGFDPNQLPEDFDPGQMGGRGQGGQRPQGGRENMTPPELPEGETFPRGEMGEGSFGGQGMMQPDSQSTEMGTGFYMNDKVNAFSGVCAVE